MSSQSFRRGAVHWVDFGGSRGGEIAKRRPTAIVSNDVANRVLNRVQVVPLTSNTARVYPSEAIVTVVGRPGKAMADQIATATKERIGALIGHTSVDDMRGVDAAIRRQLGLDV